MPMTAKPPATPKAPNASVITHVYRVRCLESVHPVGHAVAAIDSKPGRPARTACGLTFTPRRRIRPNVAFYKGPEGVTCPSCRVRLGLKAPVPSTSRTPRKDDREQLTAAWLESVGFAWNLSREELRLDVGDTFTVCYEPDDEALTLCSYNLDHEIGVVPSRGSLRELMCILGRFDFDGGANPRKAG